MALDLGNGIALNEITGKFISSPDDFQKNMFTWYVPGHGEFAFYGYSSPKVRDNKAIANWVREYFTRSSHPLTYTFSNITVKFPHDYADAEALVITADDAEIFNFDSGYNGSFPKLDGKKVGRLLIRSFTVLPVQIKKDALYWRDAPVIAPAALEISHTPAADVNDSIFSVFMLIDEPNGFYAEPEPSRLTYVLEYITAKLIDCCYNIYRYPHGLVANNVGGVKNTNKMFSPAPLAISPKIDPIDISNFQEIDVASSMPAQYGDFLNRSRIYDGVCKYWGMITRNAWGLSPMDGEITISGIYAYLDKLTFNAIKCRGRVDGCTAPIAMLMLLRNRMNDFVNEIRSRGKSPTLDLSYAPWEFQEFWLYFMLVYSSMFFYGRSDSLLEDLFYISPVRNPLPPYLDEESLGIPLYDQIVLTPLHGKHGFSDDGYIKPDVKASLDNLVEVLREPKGHIPTMDPPGKTDYKDILDVCENWGNRLDDPACPPEVRVFANIYLHNDYPKGLSSIIFKRVFQPYEELQYRNSVAGSAPTRETGPDGEDIVTPPKYFKVQDSMPLLVYSLAFEKLYALKRVVKKDCSWWNSQMFGEYFNEAEKLRKGALS